MRWSLVATIAVSLITPGSVFAGLQPCGSWRQVAPPQFQGADLMMYDVVAFAPDNASGFGLTFAPNGIDPASIILTHWDGVSWQVVDQVDLLSAPIPGIVRSVAAVSGSGPDNLWFAGTFDPAGLVFARPFLAHWDGAAWSFEYPSSDGGSPIDIGYVSDNEIYLFGDNATPWVWDGSNLSLFSPFPPVSVGAPTASDGELTGPGAFWIAGHQSADVPPPSGLSLWHWDGGQWSEYLNSDVNFLTGDTLVESHVGSLAVVAANDIWATGDKQLLSGGVFGTFLHWDGSAWTEIVGPAGVFPGQIAAVASDEVWAFAGLSASDELLFAHWDGSSWSLIPQGTLPGATPIGTGLFEMTVDPACHGWAVGRVSTDGGATFSPLILQLQSGGDVLGDLDGDGDVDLTDLAILLSDFDCTGGGCAGDVDGDGDTDLSDLSLLLSNFGA